MKRKGLRTDTKLMWRGYPSKRKRVRVSDKSERSTDAFMNYSVSHKTVSRRWTWIIILLASMALCGVLAYAVFFSGYFIVRDVIFIDSSAVPTLTEADIAEDLIEVRGRNLFLVNTPEVIAQILERNVRIKTISAERVFPDTIRVVVTEYPVVAHLWQGETNDNVLVNEAGFAVIDIADPAQYGSYPLIKTFDTALWRLDHRIIDRSDLMYMAEAAVAFTHQFSVPITRIDYLEPNREARFQTEKGWEVWFDFNRTVPASIADLILVFDEGKIADESFSTIDVRISGKVFVCRRSGTCVQNVPVTAQ